MDAYLRGRTHPTDGRDKALVMLKINPPLPFPEQQAKIIFKAEEQLQFPKGGAISGPS